MASFVLSPGPFAPGQTVGVYERSAFVGSSVPLLPAVTTGVVAADSTTTFTGLAFAAQYVAAAVVDGAWRSVAFSTEDDSSLEGATLADLALKADQTALDSGLALKANQSDLLSVESTTVRKADVELNARDYGVKFDNVTDDGAAWTAVFAALPTAGGTIRCPRGVSKTSVRWNVDGRRNVKIVGEGTENDVGGQGTTIIFTGTGSTPFISAQRTVGFELEGICLLYGDVGFTGYMIDWRNASGSGGGDSRKGGLNHCTLSGQSGSWVSPTAMLCLGNAVDLTFYKVRFQGADKAVLGREAVGDYSIAHRFRDCDFGSNQTVHIKNAGESWLFDGCIFEGLVGSLAGCYDHDAGFYTKGMTFDSCWWGDVVNPGGLGTQIKWAGSGLVLIGGRMGVEETGVNMITVDENNCRGLVVLGTTLVGPGGPLVNFGATTGHSGVLLMPGDVQDGCPEMVGPVPGNAFPDRDNQQAGILAPQVPVGRISNPLTASRAYYARFVPSRRMKIVRIGFNVLTAASANDNVDVGIYDATGTRLVSSGATAGQLNSVGIKGIAVTATTLEPGKVYYAAIAAGTFGGTAAALEMTAFQSNGPYIFGTGAGVAEITFQATAHPLPATATPATPIANVPFLAVRET